MNIEKKSYAIDSVDPGFERTCWSGRFSGAPCGRPARWRGNPASDIGFTRAWRACDEHKQPTDVLLETPDAA